MATTGSQARDIGRVLRLLRAEADRRVVSHGLATALVVVASGALAALAPLVLKSLVDAVAVPSPTRILGEWSSTVPYGVAYLLLLFAGRVLLDIRPLLSGAIQQRLHSRLTQRFFEHVLRLPMGYLLRHRSGELQHRLDLASAGAHLVVSHLAGSLLPVLVELLTMAGVLMHLGQPALVAVFGVAALAYFVIFSTGARLMARAADAVSKASLEVYAQLGDGLAHLETLRCFTAESQALQRLRDASVAREQRWRALDRLSIAIALAASCTFAVSMAGCLLIGGNAVASHTMSVGGFVLTTVYALQMVRPLESLGTAARDLSRALGYLRPLLDLLSEPPAAGSAGSAGAASEASTGRTGHSHAPSVRLERLHFGYAPDRPVIKGVDLDVAAGSTTAIVGPSGSGKSSLARLLMRLYSPQHGRILLDGRPIEAFAIADLRRTLVGLVPQETALLHDTIAANIALGSPAASREDIRMAAHGAQLGALIESLPLGLDTPVGERGLQLSGGERQRVGIARALLRRPGLYVLDEPTSMLDSRTELEIQKALRALSAGATTIVIAHRLSTIAHADEIVVLDDGRVRERGSHQALLASKGLYARMWRQQMSAPS